LAESWSSSAQIYVTLFLTFLPGIGRSIVLLESTWNSTLHCDADFLTFEDDENAAFATYI